MGDSKTEGDFIDRTSVRKAEKLAVRSSKVSCEHRAITKHVIGGVGSLNQYAGLNEMADSSYSTQRLRLVKDGSLARITKRDD